MASKMKKKDIDEYIKSKSVTQNNYTAPTVQTHVDTRAPAMVQVAQTVKPRVAETTQNLKIADNNLKVAQDIYRNKLADEIKKDGQDYRTKFDDVTSNKISYQTKSEDKPSTQPKIIPIQEANKNLQNEIKNIQTEYDKWKLANYENNAAKAAASETTLFDKTIGTPIRAISDLLSPLTTGEDNIITDEQGNKTFLPSYSELKQEQVKKDSSKLGGFLQDIGYNATKILGAGAIDAVSGGLGGKALYWTDMATDNYKNAINRGYTGKQAVANTIISTGSEFLTEKLLGGVSKTLTGGKASELQSGISKAVNKFINNPKYANIIGSMGAEGTEEFVQEWISALNNKITLGEDIDYEQTLKDALYSFGVGAGSGGVVTGTIGGGLAPEEFNPQSKLNNLNESELNTLRDITTKRKSGEQLNEQDISNLQELRKKANTPQETVANTGEMVYNEGVREGVVNGRETRGLNEAGINQQNGGEQSTNDSRGSREGDGGVRVLNETTDYKQAKQNIDNLKATHKRGAFFDTYTEDEFKTFKTYQTPDGKSSISVKPDGDITALVSEGKKGMATDLLMKARENGGTKMDCYGKFLKELYEQHGFKAVARVKYGRGFNEQMDAYVDNAIKEGKAKNDSDFDIYFMMKNTDDVDTVRKNVGKYETTDADSLPLYEYDEAYKLRDEMLAEQESGNPNLAEKTDEQVIKAKNKEEKIQNYKDHGVSEEQAKILEEMPKPEKKSIGQKIKEKKASLAEQYQYLKRNLVDKGESIYRLSKLSKNRNLYAKYDKMGTTTGEANYDIGVAQTNLEGKKFNNFIDKNGKKKSMSLNEIWEGIDTNLANEYLAHQLNIDRYNQQNDDGTRKYVFGESVTAEDSKKRVKELEKTNPELKRFGENVWQYGKNQLQNMVDAGQISKEQAKQFMKETPHYVRLQRNVDAAPKMSLEFDKTGKAKVNKRIQEFKGSTLDILPFKESMAQYTLDVRNSIRTNMFAQELAKTIGLNSKGENIETVDNMFDANRELLKDNGDGTYSLTFFNKGIATEIPINEGIYEALQPNKHYKFEDTAPFEGIRKFDNFRKALLTDKNPLFLATNMMKDAFDAPLNSKHPLQFAKNYPRAVWQVLTNGKSYQQYQALGGLQNTYFDNQGFSKEGKGPVAWLEKANNAVEQFPRLAEFMSTMEKTGNIDEAMYNAAEITTNFKRGGDWTKAANRNGVTFLNASVQGFSKQIRNFTDIQNPQQAVQLLGKLVVLGIAPGLINDIMWDDDDEYKELQDYQKDNYYLFKSKDGTWIRIPKGRAVSVFQSAARRTKYRLKGDKKAFNGFVDFAKNQVAPNSPFENNIFSPMVNVKENKSWSGNKIVNDSMSKRPEAEQYNEKTDEFSKWLGKKLNYSPMKINYLIDQYSGVFGDIGLPMITSRSSSRSNNPLTAPAIDKFTLDSVNSNKNVSTFYDVKEEIEKQKNSVNSTPIDVAKNSYMTSRSIELSELYKKQKEIQSSDLSKKEKYEQARDVQKQINEFAKETVKNVQNVDEEKYYLKIGDSYYKRVVKDGEEKYIKDSSKKIPSEKYALYDYFKEKYEKSKESD